MPRRSITALLALILTLALAGTASAAGFGSPTPGVTAKAPTDASLDTTTEQLTDGLSADEVATSTACGNPKPGEAACFAKSLVERKSRKRIHPRVERTKTFTQVFPRTKTGIAPATAAGAPAATAPNAGTPAWLQQAYDLTYLSQTGGTNATVAIVDAYDAPNAEADLATYRSRYGLPACTTANGCFKKLNQNGVAGSYPAYNQGWAQEIALDVDAVSALCPNCKIVLVEANSAYSNDLAAAIQTAVNTGAKYVSNSYGGNQYSVDSYFNKTFPGVTQVASTGDNGWIAPSAAAYPAALPQFVAAGGTSLALSGGEPTARGFGESAWSGAGSGCNTHPGIAKPAYQTDTSCSGRSYADVSAVADPSTGLVAYSSDVGGWFLVGGTSLSSPLIAAYLAVTGIDGTNPRWAYDNSALLNDPVAGSNGACGNYICNAKSGYDGPTGIGSISGALVTGAPGVAAPAKSTGYKTAASAATATLVGGVYPNSLETTYFWQYGTTTSYGDETTAASVGSGKAPVLTTSILTGLQPSTTYHYRLVAQNSAGTTYGYDYTFATANTGSNPPSNTANPVITGTPQQGQTLTVTNGTWSPAATSYAYQWQRSTDGGSTWTNISGATNATYNAGTNDQGVKLRATVTATNSFGSTSATAAPVGPISSGAPTNTSPPVINGITRRGQVLTVASTWNPASTIGYVWQRSLDGGLTWVAVGTSSSSYTLTSADLGGLIRATVSATNAFGTVTATSDPVGAVVTDPPGNNVAPVLTGTTQRTYTLTTSVGSWGGTGNLYSFQWQRSVDGSTWTAIAGATSATYALVVADEANFVRAVVTASNTDGVSTKASNATAQFIAPFPPANLVPPVISGTPQRNSTLSANRGTWTGPDNAYSYQWQRDAGEGYEDIAGANNPTYKLTVPDEFTLVRVVVKATNPDGVIVEASQPTSLVQDAGPLNQTLPTISGTIQRGSTLIANGGTWSGIGNTYAFQWQSSPDGNTWTDITGATSSSFTLGVGEEGKRVRVRVTATNVDGTQSATSAGTAIVPASPPVNTARPTLSGAATRGTTLTSVRGTWSGIGNSYAYQWQRDGVDIAGATDSTYTLTVADENTKVRLVVTATNPDATVNAVSDPTATVAASPPVNTALPIVAGTIARGQVLASSMGNWTGLGNAYTYQWQLSTDGVTWTDVQDATLSSYTLGVTDENKRVRVVVTATNPDATVSAASAPTAFVPSAPPVNTARPTISGTPQRAATLTATLGTWTGIGNSYTYQWQRDGGSGFVDIAGAINDNYTLTIADEYATVRVVVTGTNVDGNFSAPSNPTAQVAAAPPTNTLKPSITGLAQRSTTLVSDPGVWGGLGNSYGFQWQRDSGAGFVDIPGATGASYTLAVADEGAKVRILVTATNPDGSLSAASNPTATVAAAPPVNTIRPAISGAAVRASTLMATTGSWNGVGNNYTYQWQRSKDGGTSWTPINGETNLGYTLGLADVGAVVRIVITVTNPDGTASAASNQSATITGSGPFNTVRPAITGTVTRGNTLSSTLGTWNGAGNTYTVQWQSSTDGTTWNDIRGASDATYTLTRPEVGTKVRVLVTATNAEGSVSQASNPTTTVAAAPPVNTFLPVVTGTAQRSFVLSASQGTWTGAGNSFAYQWQRNPGSGWADITGATDPTYTLGVVDEGAKVRVVVTATNPDATAGAASLATATVLAAPPSYTVSPTINGAAKRGSTLVSTQGTWSGIGNVYSYQWQRDGVDISGATGNTYTLGSADVGTRVRLRVTATNPDGVVTANSIASAIVTTAPPVNVSVPTISGAPVLARQLSAGVGDWTPAGATYTYAWQRNTGSGFADISGATGAMYTLVNADLGATIRVRVTATNVDGTSSATSVATAAVTTAPVNTAAPAAPSGSPTRTSTLTANNGTWDRSDVTFAYDWYRCPSGAAGIVAQCDKLTTGRTYTLAAADLGKTIGVRVTATNAGGSTAANSALTATVTELPLAADELPSIDGTPTIPNTLSAKQGKWNLPLSSVSFEWKRCDLDGASNCVTVEASSDEYALSVADNAHTIVLFVTAVSGSQTKTEHSPPLAVSAAPLPQPTVAPVITGPPARGSILTVSNGGWTNNPGRFRYQWKRDGVDIPGATGSNYTAVKDDEGTALSVLVTAENGAGTGDATTAPTAPIAGVPPVNTARPTITAPGPIAQGVTVTASGATWQTSPDTAFTYSWERCDANGCAVIAGATGSTYTLVGADVGKSLVAVVTASNPDGTVSARSDQTQAANIAAPRWKTLPLLSNSPGRVSDVLTITAGVFTGPAVASDVTQMMRCTNVCVPTGAASAANYTIASGDVGAILRVRETAANAGGETVVWSARYVGPVINALSAAAFVGSGQTPLKNSKGQTLAVAHLPSGAHASAAKPKKAKAPVVTIKRAARAKGKLLAWACPEPTAAGATPPPCSAKVNVRRSAKLKLPAGSTGRVRVVVVQK